MQGAGGTREEALMSDPESTAEPGGPVQVRCEGRATRYHGRSEASGPRPRAMRWRGRAVTFDLWSEDEDGWAPQQGEPA
jgi:hypothetical protein